MSSGPREPDSNHPLPTHGRDLTTGSIPRHLVAFSMPMLAGSALHTAYSIVNAIWVGNGLGTTAMAAVTVSFPVLFVLMAVAGGLTMASNILVSQTYGARDWAQLRRVVQNSVVLTGVVSLACVLVGHLVAEDLLRLISTPPEVLPMAASYLRIFLWSVPFMFGIFLIAAMLRGTGDSKTPLYFQASFLGLTAVLDPLLMFGWLGFPRLGLNGTAVATIIANCGALVSLLIYLQRRRHIVAPDWRHLRLERAVSWLTLKIGIPSMLQQASVSIGMLVIVGLINAFGKTATAAFGAAMRIDHLAFMPAMTIGMAVSTLSGQNIGARRYHRVNEVFRWGLLLGGGMTLLASLLALTIPGILLRMFIPDREVIATGVQYLRIVGAGYVLFAIMFVSNGVINGAGHTFVTTLISLIALWAVRVPIAAYLSRSMHRLDGIWYAMVISFAVGSALSLAYYLSGRWKKSVVRTRPSISEQLESELHTGVSALPESALE